MPEPRKRNGARSQRLTYSKFTPPDWYGWAAVTAMFLLPVVRTPFGGGYAFPLLSLGEWLMLPLGAASVSMGLLSLARLRERTLLPLWLAAMVPGALWLAAAAAALVFAGIGPETADLFLSWVVHLLFPILAFLPLLPMRVWRNRLLWALAATVTVNAVVIFFQGRAEGLLPPDPEFLRLGGLTANQFDYGLLLALALPLLAAWRGGGAEKNRALYIMLFTFLLPVLALSACFTWAGLAAAGLGLAVCWASWRGAAWTLGIFVCLLLFGFGTGERGEREKNHRRLLTVSAVTNQAAYDDALRSFEAHPYVGTGIEEFLYRQGPGAPWYATLLGGAGLLGLGMWVMLLGELAARCLGRSSRRCLYCGGVLGAVAGMMAIGAWTSVLTEGVGAMVGVLAAFSILEEPERKVEKKRPSRLGGTRVLPLASAAEKKRGGDDAATKKDVQPS